MYRVRSTQYRTQHIFVQIDLDRPFFFFIVPTPAITLFAELALLLHVEMRLESFESGSWGRGSRRRGHSGTTAVLLCCCTLSRMWPCAPLLNSTVHCGKYVHTYIQIQITDMIQIRFSCDPGTKQRWPLLCTRLCWLYLTGGPSYCRNGTPSSA